MQHDTSPFPREAVSTLRAARPTGYSAFAPVLSTATHRNAAPLRDYRRSHLGDAKATDYEAAFVRNPYRKMVWEFEKTILDRILATHFPSDAAGSVQHLDFACGTGRILAHYEGRVSRSVGIDVSPSMLQVARRKVQRAQLIEGDLTAEQLLAGERFQLITAFRFFPNAEPELRHQAMQAVVEHLAPGGYLVFNNHMHSGGMRNRLARLAGRREFRGMSLSDVRELLASSGMAIVATYPLCIFPASESRPLLPFAVLRWVELLLSKCPLFRTLGENLVFVCRRSAEERPPKS